MSAYSAFTGETFFKTGESVIVIHRAFDAHFMLHWIDRMIMVWTSAQHVFAGETFLKTSESVIITERAFHAHLMLHWIDRMTIV